MITLFNKSTVSFTTFYWLCAFYLNRDYLIFIRRIIINDLDLIPDFSRFNCQTQ